MCLTRSYASETRNFQMYLRASRCGKNRYVFRQGFFEIRCCPVGIGGSGRTDDKHRDVNHLLGRRHSFIPFFFSCLPSVRSCTCTHINRDKILSIQYTRRRGPNSCARHTWERRNAGENVFFLNISHSGPWPCLGFRMTCTYIYVFYRYCIDDKNTLGDSRVCMSIDCFHNSSERGRFLGIFYVTFIK